VKFFGVLVLVLVVDDEDENLEVVVLEEY